MVPSGRPTWAWAATRPRMYGTCMRPTVASTPGEEKHKNSPHNVHGMNITIDQARALDALDRHGTLVRAAAALHKGHPAVLYALRQLELQAGLDLLDRRGYRLRLTPAGRRVLAGC